MHRLVQSPAASGRLILLLLAAVLLLSGCVLSPLFQAPAAMLTGVGLLLGLAACSGGGGGGDSPEPAPPPDRSNCVTQTFTPTSAWRMTASQTPDRDVVIDLDQAQSLGQALRIMEGVTGSADVGKSVSSCFDVNGDGIQDLMVGSPQWAGASDGRAFVLYGSATLASAGGESGVLNAENVTLPDGFYLTGVSDAAGAGEAVWIAGDVNADGKADVLTVTRGGLYGDKDEVWLAFGGGQSNPSLSLEDSFFFNGKGVRFEKSASIGLAEWSPSLTSGDFNGDGVLDMAFVSPGGGEGYDVAYVLFGRAGGDFGQTGGQLVLAGSLPKTTGMVFRSGTTAGTGEYSRVATANVGDVNGDGIDDLGIVDANLGNYGTVWVIFGNSAFGTDSAVYPATPADLASGEKGFVISGRKQGSILYNLLPVLGAAGDLNGDGFADLALTSESRKESTTYYYGGTVHVVFGRSDWSPVPSLPVPGASDSSAGFTLSLMVDVYARSLATGDLDGDGFADLIVGTPKLIVYDYAQSANYTPGGAIVIFGRDGSTFGTGQNLKFSTLPVEEGTAVVGPRDNTAVEYHLGAAVAVGDVNGDGFADLILGDYSFNSQGRVYILFGGPGTFPTLEVELSGLL